MDNCEILIEGIKSFMFDNTEISYGLKFVSWCGDGISFIVADRDSNEYRIRITEE